MMEMSEVIENAERNIRQALKDYRAHTSLTDVLDDVDDSFIKTLAYDSSYAKQGLRELFRKSPVYDEKLDALIINGARTHDPDYARIHDLAFDILAPVLYDSQERYSLIVRAVSFFTKPQQSEADREMSIAAINELAQKAYAPSKKPNRVFKALCVALGVADETAGSEFQKMYAQFADELSTKKISFKLFVSINPAHFLTMSNPKEDRRGSCLTSCHSFNSTDYEYNCGCSGYARDETSFIVFTVADPTDAETLNNRKTTRQIFAYEPGNGLLLQSRLYNTSGGTHGAQEDSNLYRDLIQRELSMLEEQPNLWRTSTYVGGPHDGCIRAGDGFGGYQDWTYQEFDAKVSIRKDRSDSWKKIRVGTYGLCIKCGCQIDTGLYCDDCEHENKDKCECCGEYYPSDEMYDVRNEHGQWITVCEDCRDECYCCCEDCGEYYPSDAMYRVQTADYGYMWVCEDCKDKYETCPHCGELIERCKDGTCPHCGAVIDEEEAV